MSESIQEPKGGPPSNIPEVETIISALRALFLSDSFEIFLPTSMRILILPDFVMIGCSICNLPCAYPFHSRTSISGRYL